jgi:hypothetical protein
MWAGDWAGFYVTPARTQIKYFTVNISVQGCGNFTITYQLLVPITNGKFSFGGTFHASGIFATPTSAHGTVGFTSYKIPGCGTISGDKPWSATWKNSNQTNITALSGEENSITFTPEAGQDLPTFTVDPVNP